MRVCIFYWYCYCHFTSYIIHNSRTDPWWCLYFRICSVWSLIKKIVIFKFVWTAKLDSRILAGCIREFSVYCVCHVNERCVCVCVLYDSMWCYWLFHMRLLCWKIFIIRPFNFKYEYSRVPAIKPLVVQCSILSNISCHQKTALHLSAFISCHLFYQRSTQNDINYTPHHVYMSY